MAKTMRSLVAIAVLLLLQAAVGAAQQAGTPAPNSALALKVGAGDLIEVNVFDDQDLSGRFRVDEKGDIVIPLAGRVHVEGLTAAEVGATVEQRYVETGVLRTAGVYTTVFIAEYATQGIAVSGEVRSPGLYPALGVRMLNDVITAAGGVMPTADAKVIITHKNDPSNPVTAAFNTQAPVPVMPQIQILPGDTIVVPKAGIVYVVGNVQRPGGFVLEGGRDLTVEKVMALAGGGGRAAAINRAHLVRTLEGGRKEDIVVSVSAIYKGRAPDLTLKDGDILYVPTSNMRLAAEQAITSAVSIGSSVAIYRTAYQ